jgi:hypothetical protein
VTRDPLRRPRLVPPQQHNCRRSVRAVQLCLPVSLLFCQSGKGAPAFRSPARERDCDSHRKLYLSKSMFTLQVSLAKKNLVKSLLISTSYKVIYYIGTFFRAQRKLSLQHI